MYISIYIRRWFAKESNVNATVRLPTNLTYVCMHVHTHAHAYNATVRLPTNLTHVCVCVCMRMHACAYAD